ncbi:MAG: ribosomal protein S18-alanine N-acetyltransferase [Marinobacter sp.]|uniref:ribosomal protein S18-alanine N-acetyltransferase n=1 Tax=Marinobacter sp. TaxID=50741 RepID=UPI0034A01249
MTEKFKPSLASVRCIRSLSRQDLAAVIELELQSYSHPWTKGIFLDCFRPDYRLWALDQGGELIGYAVVAYLFDEAHLLNLCVGPQYRRSGAGVLLLRHLITVATHESMHRVILEVRQSNRSAIELYIREGFEQIGERPGYYPAAIGRENASVLSLTLDG